MIDDLGIPTEPEEYDHDLVRAELAQLTELLPKLELYDDREFRELPSQLKEKVQALQSIVQPTDAGLERVDGLLWQMRNVQVLFGKVLRNESVKGFIEGVMLPRKPGHQAPEIPPATPAVEAPPVPAASPPVERSAPRAAGTLSIPAVPPPARRTPPSPTGGTFTLPAK